ncbi:MAG: dependent epimerase/dehydratase family [Bacteroidota bacterium]|jgi:nucleoside-diphosphate-sugar epimerase
MIDNVLILGGRGFLGKRISAELKKNGMNILLYNRNDNSVFNMRESNSISFGNFLANNEDILVINLLAAWGAGSNPNLLKAANYELPIRLLDEMISAGINVRWIQINSYYYFYYTETGVDKDEYSYWKRVISEKIQYKCEKIENSLNVLELYLPHLYGEKDKFNRLFEMLTRQVNETSTLDLSSGRQVLPILHVDDCARGIIEILLQEKFATKYRNMYVKEQSQMLLSDIIGVFQSFKPINVKFCALPDRRNEFYSHIFPKVECYNINNTITLEQYLSAIFEQEANA